MLYCFYSPPNITFELFLLSLACFKTVSNFKSSIIFCDFNLPEIDWNDVSVFYSARARALLDLCDDLGWSQVNCSPTRGTNVLDLVFTNDPLLVSSISTGMPFGSSDHDSIHVSVIPPPVESVSIRDTESVNVYDFSNVHWDDYMRCINDVNWTNFFANSKSADDCWILFSDFINECNMKFVSIKTLKPENRISNTKTQPRVVKNLLLKKHKLWKKLKEDPSDIIKSRYSLCVASIKTVQDDLEFKKEKKIIESQNLGVLYKHINSRMSHKQGIAPLKDYYGNIVSDDAGKASILNINFSQMCTIDDGKIPLPIIDYNNTIIPPLLSFSSIHFNEHLICNVINKLDGNCSPGPDGFRSILLKCLKPVICRPLSILFTKMFNFGAVPNDWKKAIVKPIFKKGSASDPNNYRPISLTSVICKVFETIIKNQLLDYLNEYSLLSREQHGFLSKHSTTTNLLESLNDWTASLDKHLVTKILYMDFEKAFNCVSVPKLLCKLERFGINGNLLLCIKSFLTGRSQCVSIDNYKSSYLPIVSGVPQGSVLGPLLFLLYINDLPNIFCEGIVAKLFADDLKSYNVLDYRSNPSIMQNAVHALLGWCTSWQLNLSSSKCGSLLLNGNSNFRDSETILMGKEDLKTLETFSDLGVVIVANLYFSPHIGLRKR